MTLGVRTALAALHRRTGSTDDDDAGSVQREDSEIEPSDRMAVEIGPFIVEERGF